MTQRYVYFPYPEGNPQVVTEIPDEFNKPYGPGGEEYLQISPVHTFIYNIVDPSVFSKSTRSIAGEHRLTQIPGPGLVYMSDEDGEGIVPVPENIIEQLPQILINDLQKFYSFYRELGLMVV